MSPLVAHFRRFARDLRNEIRPTPEFAVLRELERRATSEPRRAGGEVAFAPYRFTYVDAMSTWPQWNDIFIQRSLDFAADVAEPRILDCGANIGLASIFLKHRYPAARVTAFEPDPRLAAICRSNLAQTATTAQIDVQEAAVWTMEGTLEFVCEGTDSGAIAALHHGSDGPVAAVRSMRLRDRLDEPVDLLKLDIEGAELLVLDDCRDRLGNVRAMIVELHEFEAGKRQTGAVFDLLTYAGFVFDMRAVTPLPWRTAQVRSPFRDSSLDWVTTVRAWRR